MIKQLLRVGLATIFAVMVSTIVSLITVGVPVAVICAVIKLFFFM